LKELIAQKMIEAVYDFQQPTLLMQILMFLSMVLTGAGKAVRDTIAHHFAKSVLYQLSKKYPKLLKWLKSDYRDWPLHFGFLRLDAWHVADMLHYSGIMFSIAAAAYLHTWTWGIFFFLAVGFWFHMFYTVWLVSKKYRR
jgi:hypothetical protein